MRGETVEIIRPEALIAFEPFIGLLHRFGVESAGDNTPGFAAFNEASVGQHAEMLHHGRQRHRQRLG